MLSILRFLFIINVVLDRFINSAIINLFYHIVNVLLILKNL